jgi:hypothetical protein
LTDERAAWFFSAFHPHTLGVKTMQLWQERFVDDETLWAFVSEFMLHRVDHDEANRHHQPADSYFATHRDYRASPLGGLPVIAFKAKVRSFFGESLDRSRDLKLSGRYDDTITALFGMCFDDSSLGMASWLRQRTPAELFIVARLMQSGLRSHELRLAFENGIDAALMADIMSGGIS